MAHFAELDKNNIVIQVIVVNNKDINESAEEETGIKFCKDLFGSDTIWKQTSYSTTFRSRFAAIGGTYDPIADEFVDAEPNPSWNLDESNEWQPPTPKPEDGHYYDWDESNLSWFIIREREAAILVAVDGEIVNS